jgi:Ca2+-binding RTX toxin-like protein
MDLNQIAMDFDMKVNAKLAADREIPNAVLLGNSRKSVVTNPFPVDSLTKLPIIDALGKAKVFMDENANQRQSLFGRISGASSGAEQDKFFDADDADNLIQIKPIDALQLGGLRAWGGHDRILGTDASDIVNGNAGNDEIAGAGGHDLLLGGQGNDMIAAGEGDDLLLGQKGDDELFGGPGNDVIRGGEGADVLIGNVGNDMLIAGGGEERDFLIGSTGADQFILGAETLAKTAADANRICDFNPSEGDLIKIAYFDGTLNVASDISFAAVDVNIDDIQDTAILRTDGVVGVILGKDLTQQTNLQSSIFMVNPKDTALSMIG